MLAMLLFICLYLTLPLNCNLQEAVLVCPILLYLPPCLALSEALMDIC